VQQIPITKRQRQFDLPGAIRLRRGVALHEATPRNRRYSVTSVAVCGRGLVSRSDAAVRIPLVGWVAVGSARRDPRPRNV
jgi:hypothetical protein